MSKKIYFTPGPSQLFYSLPFHIKNALEKDIGSISHRSKEFQNIFQDTRNNLSDLLDLPDGYEIFFTGSATEIWERLLQNLVTQHSHHFVNGSFSSKFYEFTKKLNIRSTSSKADLGKEFENFEVPEDTELISITVNETSTGYTFDKRKMEEVRNANPNALICWDVVSITPAVKLDFSLCDTAYFSVQKCFGLPAGLGVWIVNEKVLQKAEQKSRVSSIGTYHDLLTLKKYGDKNQTPETPNVWNIYLLNGVIQDMLARGIDQIRNDTIYKSTILYQSVEDHQFLSPAIDRKDNRSRTVCVANVMEKQSELLEYLATKGMIIGKGYGDQKDTQIRIANFPTHSREQVEMLTDYLKKFE